MRSHSLTLFSTTAIIIVSVSAAVAAAIPSSSNYPGDLIWERPINFYELVLIVHL